METRAIELPLLLVECGDHRVLIGLPSLELNGQPFDLFLVPKDFSLLSLPRSLRDLSLGELLFTSSISDRSIT